MRVPFCVVLCVLLFFSAGAYAQRGRVLFIEDFNNLDDWEPLFFPSIKEHSAYKAESEGELSFLRAESRDSASAIMHKREFSPYEHPRLKWRWMVENVYEKGEAGKQSGDDFPMRVYVMFKYDPEKAGLFERIKYGIAKRRFGRYPPKSALCYVWANRPEEEEIMKSPYFENSKLVVLEEGKENVGRWLNEEVNIIEDYRKAFGEDPPEKAAIAIMNDSDNTGEGSVSYIDFIEVAR